MNKKERNGQGTTIVYFQVLKPKMPPLPKLYFGPYSTYIFNFIFTLFKCVNVSTGKKSERVYHCTSNQKHKQTFLQIYKCCAQKIIQIEIVIIPYQGVMYKLKIKIYQYF